MPVQPLHIHVKEENAYGKRFYAAWAEEDLTAYRATSPDAALGNLFREFWLEGYLNNPVQISLDLQTEPNK